MKSEASDTLRNWIANLRYFVCHRSNDIGGFLIFLAVIFFLVFVFFPMLEAANQ